MLRAAALACAVAVAVSCGDHPTVAPKAIAPDHSRLSLRPSFQKAPPGGPIIDLKSVVALLVSPNGDTLRSHAEFAGDSAILVFDVALPGGASTYNLDVTALDTQGQAAYHTNGPVTLKPGENNPSAPQLVYSAADATLQVLHVSPASLQLNAGGSGTLGVSGTGANNTPISTIHVGWTSKDATIATVDGSGVVHAGVLQASTYVVARTFNNVADSALVRVRGNVAKVTVAPATLTLARGVAGAVGAELRDAADHLIDDRTATWTSSNPGVATVSAAGVVQGVAIGTATITATAEGKSASATVTVISPLDHIELAPSTLTFLSLGETQNVTPRLVPVSGASVAGIAVTLESSNTGIVTVDASGAVTAKANGTATVKATAEGKEATATVTVRQEAATLSVSPAFAGVTSLGESRTFTATAADARGNAIPADNISWSSSDPGIAPVTAGVAVGKAAGAVTITASSGARTATATFNVAQVPVSMTLFADRTSIQIGTGAQLRANVTDALGNSIASAGAIYTSLTPNFASVSATGRVQGIAFGDAVIQGQAGTLTSTITIHILPITGTQPTGNTSGIVTDGSSSQPISGATVSGANGATTTSGADGAFLITATSGSSLTASASGFVPTTYFNVQVGSSGTTSLGALPLAPVSQSNGTITGRIIDGATAAGIGSATVTIRAGINATTGSVVASPAVDQIGGYIATLPAGTYTLTATASGYSTNSATIVSIGGATASNQNVSIVPSSGLRITLTWGAQPRDLDSHLFGPDANGGRFHTWFGGRVGPDGEQLDNDFTGGFGPENTTVPNPLPGVYRFYVQHFSGSSSMAAGNATVTVTLNGTVLGTFHAPTRTNEVSGDIWEVFSLSGSTLTAINTFVSGSSGSVPEALRRTSSPAAVRTSAEVQAEIRDVQAAAAKTKKP